MSTLTTRHGVSRSPDAATAVGEIAAQLSQPDMSAVLVFCSPSYDLEVLGRCLEQSFSCPILGCTSSGQIGPDGFQKGGITAVSLASASFTVEPCLITPLADAADQVALLGQRVRRELEQRRPGAHHSFGLLLVDGLAMQEEQLAAALYQSLGDVPIIGGSAGDDLAFDKTFVYHQGRFLGDAAVFALVTTSHPFRTFKFQHFTPTGDRMVITRADVPRRIVYEINGLPALEAYSEAIGVPATRLDAQVLSKHPIMVKIRGDYYVRSIRAVNADGSLSLFCGVEEGVVLTLGASADPIATIEAAFAEVAARVGDPAVVLGCDCILRRLELEQDALDARVGSLLARHHVIGFSTYGEQFNSIHVNQTFTGVMIGREAA